MDLPIFRMVRQWKVVMRGVFQRENRTKVRLKDQFVYHLDNVSLSYGQMPALKNITLTINPGDMLFLTGKSGAGKTSLLNLIADNLQPTSGKIYGTGEGDRFCARVFQDLKLLNDLTCEENIWYAFDKSIYKNKSEFQSDMMELVNILGIKDKLKLPIAKANGGLKHKTALIRALLTRPQVLLADEPTASLDKENANKIFDLLNFYNVKRNLTVIWATHNRDLVKNFPGKIVHLENGKLVYSGHACFI